MCSILFSVSHARCAKTPRHALFSQTVACASSPGCSSRRTAKLEWALKGRCPECRPASEARPASVRSWRENRRQDRHPPDRPSQATHPRPGSEDEEEATSSERAAARGSPGSKVKRPPAPSTNVQAVEEADAQGAKEEPGIEEQQGPSSPAHPPASSQPPSKQQERPPAPRPNTAKPTERPEPADASLPRGPLLGLTLTPAQKRKGRTRRGQPGASHEPPTGGHRPRRQPATESPPPTHHTERDASPGPGTHRPRDPRAPGPDARWDPRTEPRSRNRYTASSSSSSSSSSSPDEPRRRTALETASAQLQNTFRAPSPSSSSSSPSSDPPAPWGPPRTGRAGSEEREREGSAAWGVVWLAMGILIVVEVARLCAAM